MGVKAKGYQSNAADFNQAQHLLMRFWLNLVQ